LQGVRHARDTILPIQNRVIAMSIFARALPFRARRSAFILAALLAASLLGACGQKGALKLPQDPPKTAPADNAK